METCVVTWCEQLALAQLDDVFAVAFDVQQKEVLVLKSVSDVVQACKGHSLLLLAIGKHGCKRGLCFSWNDAETNHTPRLLAVFNAKFNEWQTQFKIYCSPSKNQMVSTIQDVQNAFDELRVSKTILLNPQLQVVVPLNTDAASEPSKPESRIIGTSMSVSARRSQLFSTTSDTPKQVREPNNSSNGRVAERRSIFLAAETSPVKLNALSSPFFEKVVYSTGTCLKLSQELTSWAHSHQQFSQTWLPTLNEISDFFFHRFEDIFKINSDLSKLCPLLETLADNTTDFKKMVEDTRNALQLAEPLLLVVNNTRKSLPQQSATLDTQYSTFEKQTGHEWLKSTMDTITDLKKEIEQVEEKIGAEHALIQSLETKVIELERKCEEAATFQQNGYGQEEEVTQASALSLLDAVQPDGVSLASSTAVKRQMLGISTDVLNQLGQSVAMKHPQQQAQEDAQTQPETEGQQPPAEDQSTTLKENASRMRESIVASSELISQLNQHLKGGEVRAKSKSSVEARQRTAKTARGHFEKQRSEIELRISFLMSDLTELKARKTEQENRIQQTLFLYESVRVDEVTELLKSILMLPFSGKELFDCLKIVLNQLGMLLDEILPALNKMNIPGTLNDLPEIRDLTSDSNLLDIQVVQLLCNPSSLQDWPNQPRHFQKNVKVALSHVEGNIETGRRKLQSVVQTMMQLNQALIQAAAKSAKVKMDWRKPEAHLSLH